MRIAVIGAGISGLVCARTLSARHDVIVFERNVYPGGHTNTVRVDLGDETHHVDTGFIVHNQENYPGLCALLDELGVGTQLSEMSFSVSEDASGFEYRGNGTGLWAQPANALSPGFQKLLVDILRFNRDARRVLDSPGDDRTVTEMLRDGGYGPRLERHYVVPLGSAIWSADPASFGDMPATMFARFLDNHGMLRLKGRPKWRTVTGGAARYVEAITGPLGNRLRLGAPVSKVARRERSVTVLSGAGPEEFDAVVLALHADEALELLGDPAPSETETLGSIHYIENVATLHTDAAMLPRRRRAWASWNVHLPGDGRTRPVVTYWMNNLQRLTSAHEICVTLNRSDEIDPSRVAGEWHYAHPVYDRGTVRAQARLSEIQGHRRTWFCGAYWGYGFHEDGVQSALAVCRAIGDRCR